MYDHQEPGPDLQTSNMWLDKRDSVEWGNRPSLVLLLERLEAMEAEHSEWDAEVDQLPIEYGEQEPFEQGQWTALFADIASEIKKRKMNVRIEIHCRNGWMEHSWSTESSVSRVSTSWAVVFAHWSFQLSYIKSNSISLISIIHDDSWILIPSAKQSTFSSGTLIVGCLQQTKINAFSMLARQQDSSEWMCGLLQWGWKSEIWATANSNLVAKIEISLFDRQQTSTIVRILLPDAVSVDLRQMLHCRLHREGIPLACLGSQTLQVYRKHGVLGMCFWQSQGRTRLEEPLEIHCRRHHRCPRRSDRSRRNKRIVQPSQKSKDTNRGWNSALTIIVAFRANKPRCTWSSAGNSSFHFSERTHDLPLHPSQGIVKVCQERVVASGISNKLRRRISCDSLQEAASFIQWHPCEREREKNLEGRRERKKENRQTTTVFRWATLFFVLKFMTLS